MTQATYMRTSNTIKATDGSWLQTYRSINQAKRASRALQMDENGVLGRGFLIAKDTGGGYPSRQHFGR